MNIETVAIVGAGDWGRALALLISRKIKRVILWHRPTTKIFPLPSPVHCTVDQNDLTAADIVLFCVPSQQIRSASATLAPFINKKALLINCAKGIENNTLLMMTEILRQTLPDRIYGVLSGPNFAREVLHGLPAAATIALEGGTDVLEQTKEICLLLESAVFRLYWGSDTTGMQIAGAVKNILAVGCGVITGQGLGENARAAILARGLNEMVRIGLSRGALLETFMGLTGVGDLILTCTSFQSRNFQCGYQLGKNLATQHKEKGLTTEGISNARSILAFAQSSKVDVPIIETIHDIIEKHLPLEEAIKRVMSRPLSAE